MPPAGLINQWPKADQDELDRLLVENGHGRLKDIAAIFTSKGYEISIATIGRHSKKLKDTLSKAMERAQFRLQCARALGGMSAGDKAALLEANEMVLIDKLMDVMDDWDDIPKEERPKRLAPLIRAASEMANSARNLSLWKADNQAKIEREAIEGACTRIDTAARAQGLSEEQARFWREQVLGVS